jgi:phosphoribosylformylglycinamidine synthase
MRIEVYYAKENTDGRAYRLVRSLDAYLDIKIQQLTLVDVYLLENLSLTPEEAGEIFTDPVAQRMVMDGFTGDGDLLPDWNFLVEVTYKPGVTDTVALTAREAIKAILPNRLDDKSIVQTACQYLFEASPLSSSEKDRLMISLYNPLIQNAILIEREQWNKGKRPPGLYPHQVKPSPARVETLDLISMEDRELLRLSRKRLLALSLEEMRAIREEWSRSGITEKRKKLGLPAEITDVELEMLAQTWSEHCKHKIFQAVIHYTDGEREEKIDSIFRTYIKKTTEELSGTKNYLRSVFHDDSGVVAFDEETLLCFKVETHNSPSALDPYGGAITGIVGVNRDIIGTGKGAKPIFNTNVLCFGPLETSLSEMPRSLLHPRQVMGGVHRGIVDGGNQSGIPVVGGAFLFDDSFLGKPLVFCGTGGILPSSIGGEGAWIARIEPGDLAVMVGGRIGKDGIHGATFSSQALDEESPTSAVQIGDPITQKKMLDFLLEARDLELFRGITDNGAGGLSSSLGEMARDSNGVRIELDLCPLKYPGLAPWEILVSESQERMSLAVPPGKLDEFVKLAGMREVEATVVGEFTGTGSIEIYYRGKTVGMISCDFLHEGLPRMELRATWKAPETAERSIPSGRNLKSDILNVLADPNVASKEELVRQYDHEVQAMSVVKPFAGVREDGPGDGAVLKPRLDSSRGITVTHGICPRYGDYDTYHMAMCAVDEAFRTHIGCGGDPDRASALDNFCWPDPIVSESNPDGEYKLAQLVRAGQGLRKACLSYGLPLISGKDSMKNDAVVDGRKLSVRPTLLVSLMGIIPDIRMAVTTDLKNSGDLLFILGESRGELGGSCFEKLLDSRMGSCPTVFPDRAMEYYRVLHSAITKGWIRSCHDLSDGGLAVAVCEAALGGRLGLVLDLDNVPVEATDFIKTVSIEMARLLFCETPSRFLISASPRHGDALLSLFEGLPLNLVGRVSPDDRVIFQRGGKAEAVLTLSEIEEAWKGQFK